MRTSAGVLAAVPRRDERGYISKDKTEVDVLVALVVILLILAIVGGLAIHPLLFLLAILALLVLFGGRRGAIG